MKRILFSLLLLAPFFASAQTDNFNWIKQKVYTASGTDTYTVTMTGMNSYVLGFEPKIKFTNANTGAATLNVNSIGAIALKKNGATDLSAGDIPAGVTMRISYDGTYFQVLGIGGGGGGSVDTTAFIKTQGESILTNNISIEGGYELNFGFNSTPIRGFNLNMVDAGASNFADYYFGHTSTAFQVGNFSLTTGNLSIINDNESFKSVTVGGSSQPAIAWESNNAGSSKGIRALLGWDDFTNTAGYFGVYYNTDGSSTYSSSNYSFRSGQGNNYLKGNLFFELGSDTNEDLYIRRSNKVFNLPIGSNSQVLTITGGTIGWATPSAGFSDPMTTRGDIIYRNSSNTTARLGRGTANQVLTSDGTDISWATPSSGGADALGTYLVQTATNAPANAQIMGSLATGIVKNTTTTGVQSIAVAGTDYLTPTGSAAGLTSFPTLNQNTTGSAATLTTPRTIGIATGDVTSAGSSFDGSANNTNAYTIANSAVTLAKMADIATSSLIYRKTAGTGAPEVNTLATLKTDLGLTGTNSGDQTITLTGDVTGSGTGSFPTTIANDAVTYAKMQNVSAASKLLGRGDSGSGDTQEITIGSGLTMTGTTLSASSGSGDVTAASNFGTDNLLIRSDGTTKGVQASIIGISDFGNVTIGSGASNSQYNIDTDGSITNVDLRFRSKRGGNHTQFYINGSSNSLGMTDGTNLVDFVFGSGITNIASGNALLIESQIGDFSLNTLGNADALKLQTNASAKLSFFNATPVVKQSAPTTAQGIADVLTAYGLIPTSTISGGGSSHTFSTQSGTSYTLVSGDNNSTIAFTNSSPITVTLPNGLSTGFQANILKAGTGNITLTAATTLESNGSTIETIHTGATVEHKGSNVWSAVGSLGAPLPVPLNSRDYWEESRFLNNAATVLDEFGGAAISSGTNSTAIPASDAVIDGQHEGGVFLRSSTTANGGYRYQTSSLITHFFGQKAHKFSGVLLWRTAFTNTTTRLGFHDTSTSADAVDGAYFEIDGSGVASAKTASNSVRTTHGTTYTLSLDVWYRFEIEAAENGSSINFKIYNDNSDALLLNVSNTTNIPTTRARACGAGIVATESTTVASDILVISSMGLGTVKGYNKAKQ